MSETTYPAQFAPDNPMRRLPWVLAIAVLLVLIAMVGLGRLLHPPARQRVKSRPLMARIYELPASKGSMAVKPVPRGQHPAHARQAPRHDQLNHSDIPLTRGGASAFAPHSQSVKQRKSPGINWANLQSQVSAAVSHSESSMFQTHDPHTLMARYYLASLLEKLQRIGDMNDPTSLTGMPVVRLVVGTHGELQQLTLLRSSGNSQLDQDALQIARESAPFAPFPDRLRRQTQHIDVVCYMKFVGYRQLYAGY